MQSRNTKHQDARNPPRELFEVLLMSWEERRQLAPYTGLVRIDIYHMASAAKKILGTNLLKKA